MFGVGILSPRAGCGILLDASPTLSDRPTPFSPMVVRFQCDLAPIHPTIVQVRANPSRLRPDEDIRQAQPEHRTHSARCTLSAHEHHPVRIVARVSFNRVPAWPE